MANQFSGKSSWPIEQIRAWVESGKTLRWIGEQIGCQNQNVSKICKRHDILCQRTGPRSGAGHTGWKGGRTIDKDGYVLIQAPSHPHANNAGYVREHRLVMEKHLGRHLLRSEVVHHLNSVKNDNRIENLEVFSSNGKHLARELKGRCPNWTPEGKEKISLAHKKLAAIRVRNAKGRLLPKAGDSPSNQTDRRLTDEPDSTSL